MASQIISRLRGIYGKATQSLGSEYTYSNLTYPQELDSFSSGQNHMIVFHIWERNGSQFKSPTTLQNSSNRVISSYNGKNLASAAQGLVNKGLGMTDNLPKQLQNLMPTELTSKVQSGMKNAVDAITNGWGGTSELKQTICLYMPLAYTSSHSVSWNATDMPIKNWLTAGSITDLVKQGGLSLLEGGLELLNPTFSNLTGTDLEKVVQSGLGVVRNPWQEQLFERVNFRTFNFAFAFRPKNEKEAKIIREIVQTFKFHMHPEVATNLANRYWIYPSEFTIEFWAGGQRNNFLNKIGKCVLSNMSINYADGGVYATHRQNQDGNPPVACGLTLDFTEIELVTKNSIVGEYGTQSNTGDSTQASIASFPDNRVD